MLYPQKLLRFRIILEEKLVNQLLNNSSRNYTSMTWSVNMILAVSSCVFLCHNLEQTDRKCRETNSRRRQSTASIVEREEFYYVSQ